MNAFGISIGFFCYLTAIGYAVLAQLNQTDQPIRTLLLSPAVGIAITVLPVFFINRYGIPVREFATPCGFVTILLSGISLFLSRSICSFPWRSYLPFAVVLLVAAVLTGRPMFDFGFDWLSFGNDDMANYALGAQRFYNHGFFERPNIDDLIAGKDYSQLYWFMHVAGKVRSGSDLLLAYVWGVTGLNPHQSFMPVMLALHLSLIAATSAMVYRSEKDKKAALWTAILMAISALTSLGTLYQLIAQVGGLTLLVAAMRYAFAMDERISRAQAFRSAVILALLTSALVIYYPEVIPFPALGLVVYSAFLYLSRRRPSRGWITIMIATICGSLAVLNVYILDAVSFLLMQAAKGSTAVDVTRSLFPYFLVPSGLANLWGFTPIADSVAEPWRSLAILAAIGMVVVTLIASIACVRRELRPYPAILTVMAILGLNLFANNKDFGLFKLAMFVQPFLLATVATYSVGYVNKWPQAVLFTLLISTSLVTQTGYREMVPTREKSGRNDVPYEFTKFASAAENLPANATIASDTQVIVVAKLQSFYALGRELFFPGRAFWADFDYLRESIENSVSGSTTEYLTSVERAKITTAIDALQSQFHTHHGAIAHFDRGGAQNSSTATHWIVTSPSRDILNLSGKNDVVRKEHNFVILEHARLENHLTFVHSSLGNHYYLGDLDKVSFFKPEKDVIFSGRLMRGLGSFLLFRADGATNRSMLRFELTTSLIHDGENSLPLADLVGDQRCSLGLVGRGSARIFSKPFSFQEIDGASYFAIDMNRPGKFMPFQARGLMHLYGAGIPLDQRRLVAFGRDITLLKADERLEEEIPMSIEKFPQDLGNRSLEYSGLYEDGWVSEKAFVVLRKKAQELRLRIKGELPVWMAVGNGMRITVVIEGKEMANQMLIPGKFDLALPVPGAEGAVRIDLRFDRYGQLPAPDSRPITVLLNFIGFV
jgi:hypothetical protein